MQTITVPAKAHWFATGIKLEKGKTYSFEANGLWYDDKIECGPDGYTLRTARPPIAEEYWPLFHLVANLRPLNTDQWFQLIGKVDADVFTIGTKLRYIAKLDGELFCTANDCPFMYWNNSGQLTLSVSL